MNASVRLRVLVNLGCVRFDDGEIRFTLWSLFPSQVQVTILSSHPRLGASKKGMSKMSTAEQSHGADAEAGGT
jgi:hypothetical protein